MSKNEPVVFKSEDSLWKMLANGIKPWDARLFDISDERIRRLAAGHWEEHPPHGRTPSYFPDENFVCYLNKLTGQTIQFRFRGLKFVGWAPGWCFIQLGGRVATYDNDGGLINAKM